MNEDASVPEHVTYLSVDGLAQIKADQAKINSLRMREEDFKGLPGYQRRPKMVTAEDGSLVEDPSGAYTWTYDYDPSSDSKAGAMVANEMAHAWNADTEHKLNGGTARTIREATLAEGPAGREGWTPRGRTHGVSVGRGSIGVQDWRVRQIARRAAVKYSTAYAHLSGRHVGAWARSRIEKVA